MIAMIEVTLWSSISPTSISAQLPAGIRKATAWYNHHISLARPPIRGQSKPPLPVVVLLTDDVANRQKAEKEGLTCVSGGFHLRFHSSSTSIAIISAEIRRRPQGVNPIAGPSLGSRFGQLGTYRGRRRSSSALSRGRFLYCNR